MPGIKVSKKTILKVAARIYFIFAVLFVIIADNCTNDPYFVPVMSIDGVPALEAATDMMIILQAFPI